MVYFNCCKCNNGFKKSQVEQHMYQCGSKAVCCIDCNKDFGFEQNIYLFILKRQIYKLKYFSIVEFKAHIKCITESEKYESKSSYVSKANKGEVKQNAWFEVI